PEVCDMYRSTRMMSNLRRFTTSSASSPRPIRVTLYPSIWSTLAQLSRRVRSSSTMRMRMLAFTSAGMDSGSRPPESPGGPSGLRVLWVSEDPIGHSLWRGQASIPAMQNRQIRVTRAARRLRSVDLTLYLASLVPHPDARTRQQDVAQ